MVQKNNSLALKGVLSAQSSSLLCELMQSYMLLLYQGIDPLTLVEWVGG